ncbi:MAG: substrate-binding domain-containing protein [Clostridiaceae bacterium]|nr:substrate-binding domain-containing protein [Clostridiaceae bacterium]
MYSVKGSGTFVSPKCKSLQNSYLRWALIMPDVIYDLYSSILRGVSDVASKENISVSVYNTDNDVERQHGFVKLLLETHIDGLIIIPAISNRFIPETYELLKKNNIPFVFCNRGVESLHDVPVVCSNGFYGAYIATKHLIEHGYRNPAFLAAMQYIIMIERYHGYTAALMENGITPNFKNMIMDVPKDNHLDGYTATKQLFSGKDKPDGLFLACELLLPGVYKALNDMGITVSDDVGIVSYDSSALCESATPKTTAVSFQSYQAGYESATILKELMMGERPEGINMHILHPKLIVRDSCKGRTINI